VLKFAAALVAWSTLAWAQVQEAPPAPRFNIQSFSVEGNTLLPQTEVDRLVAPFLGAGRDFGTVQQALEALTEAYVGRGYNAVRVLVPEQDLVSGRVRLQVIEARVKNVRLEGNRFFDKANIVASLPALRVGEPPNTRAIGQNVQLANENPAKQVSIVFEGTDAPGEADAILRVADFDPRRVTLSLDNTGTPQTGNLRAGAGYQNANLTGRDDVLNAQFITSPTKASDVKIFGVGYRLPVYSWGGAFDLTAGYSDVSSGTVQNLFNVSGSGTILGARYTQGLQRVGAYEQRLAFGLDYRAFKQNVTLVGTTGTLVPDITIHPVSLSYTGRLSELGSDLSVVASVAENLPGGNDGDQTAFTLQRPGAPARYRIYRLNGAWSKTLPADYLFRAVGNLQYTRDPLVPGEQFGMGGQDSVRGFYERESANDVGTRLSAELYGPEIGEKIAKGWRARILGFADAAQGSDRAPARAADTGLSSVGIGLRMNEGRSISIRADAARVLNTSGTRPDNRGRIHFALAYSF
jgi:hemolysin activation/secretion protein